jgi:hypothetical protein
MCVEWTGMAVGKFALVPAKMKGLGQAGLHSHSAKSQRLPFPRLPKRGS